jgi:SMODS and SLOG-associating 2TM effector domain family 4
VDSVTTDLIKEARRIEEDCLYTAKAHFEAAQMWRNLHLWIGIPAGVLAAVAGASALSQFDNHNILAGVVSIIVVALTAISTFLNPNEKAQAHLSAGNRYNALKNQVRIFHEIDVHLDSSTAELAHRLKDLAKQHDELNQHSPPSPRWAFVQARQRIEEGEVRYQVDTVSETPGSSSTE